MYRKIYFSVWNGEMEDPTRIPPYCAIVEGSEVILIQACYSLANIERNGELWALKQKLKSEEEWSNYKWLLPNLKKYLENTFTIDIDYAEKLFPRYEYIPVWRCRV